MGLNVTLNHALAGVIGSHGQNVLVHVTKVQEPDHVNVTVHLAHQLTSVHALANQMNPNHVTFHHAKTSAILVSGVAGLIVIPNVALDNKLVSEHVTVQPVPSVL